MLSFKKLRKMFVKRNGKNKPKNAPFSRREIPHIVHGMWYYTEELLSDHGKLTKLLDIDAKSLINHIQIELGRNIPTKDQKFFVEIFYYDVLKQGWTVGDREEFRKWVGEILQGNLEEEM